MQLKKLVAFSVLFGPLLLSAASPEESHGSALLEYLGKTVNFILLFGLLAFLLARPIRAFLAARAAQAKAEMEEAESSRREAEQKLADIGERLRRLDEEVSRLKGKGEAEGRAEAERILARARGEAEKLWAFARQEISHQVEDARRELRAYAAGLAVSLARSRIEKRLTAEVHARLIDASISDIGKLNEKSSSD